jgi:hypothetical protein
MWNILAATLLLATLNTPAFAVEARLAQRSGYTCEHGGLSRVGLRAQPAACCEGLLGCPQLLTSSGLIKPRRSNRT